MRIYQRISRLIYEAISCLPCELIPDLKSVLQIIPQFLIRGALKRLICNSYSINAIEFDEFNE
jgi:hypothetical protein